MNPLESQLDYPFGEALPAVGAALPVAPGVRWLRMGLPFALDHINLWLLDDSADSVGSGGDSGGGGDSAGSAGSADGSGGCGAPGSDNLRGLCAVDCGIADAGTRAAWESVLAGQDGLPLLRVLATHCHPDHVGLSGWLCARWNVPLWMSAAEYGFARMMSAGLPGVDGTAVLPFFERHGMAGPELAQRLEERKNYYPTLVPEVPNAFRRLSDGQMVRIGGHGWRVVTGCGHSPEHVALHCPELKVLISGDMVLPRISTNVSVFAVEPDGDPLRLYLDSLGKFADLPDDTLVLPSHGRPFRGLHTRIAQLRAHHAARLAEVTRACADGPRSAAEVVPVMFPRPLDAHQLSFAMGEALAHLHLLWHERKLQRTTDKKGVTRFFMI